MDVVKKLLAIDAGKIKEPTKNITMRLNKLGEEFTFPCKAVDPEYVAELQENAIKFKRGDIDKIKMYDTKVMTIIEGCPDIFKNKKVREHFGAATPKDLVKKIMLSGEMDKFKAEIDKLGGYNPQKDEEEVKN